MFQKSNIIQQIRLLFSKEKESYFALYRIIGFYPRRIEYYKEALLHKSTAVRGAKGRMLNNERLEFLGDAVLDAIVADVVYRHFDGKREGFLTNTRSKIVQRETLNKLAVDIGLDKLIKYSTHSSNHNSYMCGNAFEALVGAIYLDQGYDACMRFMQERILYRLINLDKLAYKEVNFKSKLIEWSQKNKVEIEFRLVEETEEVGSPVFRYEVQIEGLAGGNGKGYSKKESQQAAAKQALTRLKKDAQFLDAVFAAKKERGAVELTDAADVGPDEGLATVYSQDGKETQEEISRAEVENSVRYEEMTVEETEDHPEVKEELSEMEKIIAAAEEQAFSNDGEEETPQHVKS